jgi:hypothetical protein
MPYGDGTNRRWLHQELGSRIRPEWNKPHQRWEIARTHLYDLVVALADRFGVVDVFLEHSLTQVCDKRCREAVGDDCECSCVGEHHGGGSWLGWAEVGETTLVRPGCAVKHLQFTRDSLFPRG